MKLINSHTLKLEEFPGPASQVYTILSHTWDKGEISYQEMTRPTHETYAKSGYRKIMETCKKAAADGYTYVWVDTCCIDKTSSAELTEAINSMFTWYAKATKCYVYLSDLAPNLLIEKHFASGHCRWLKRGWTLQELIAPSDIDFLDSTWTFVATKSNLRRIISACTGIPVTVLAGKQALQSCSVAMRMSWASQRETSRTEDQAYCLFGIFDVSMPLIYGEGDKAFRRLVEEVIKHSNDTTIFAWSHVVAQNTMDVGQEFLPPSAAVFKGKEHIQCDEDLMLNFSITNKGLLFSGTTNLRILDNLTPYNYHETVYILIVGHDKATHKPIGVQLLKINPQLYCRAKAHLLYLDQHSRQNIAVTDPYITYKPISPNFVSRYRRSQTPIIVPPKPFWRLFKVAPHALWDYTDSTLLWHPHSSSTRTDTVLAMLFCVQTNLGRNIRILVLCNNSGSHPKAGVTAYEGQAEMIFHPRYEEFGITWSELQSRAPQLCELPSVSRVRMNGHAFEMKVRFELCTSKWNTDTWALRAEVEELPDSKWRRLWQKADKTNESVRQDDWPSFSASSGQLVVEKSWKVESVVQDVDVKHDTVYSKSTALRKIGGQE